VVYTLQLAGFNYEIILVNDGSHDATWSRLEKIHSSNKRVKIIDLATNYGQIIATTCGIHHSSGQIIVTIDDDLQFPANEILRLTDTYFKTRKPIVFGYPDVNEYTWKYAFWVVLAKKILHNLTLPSYRKINFFTSFRLFERSVWFNGSTPRDQHLFYIWEFPIEKCAHVSVNHRSRRVGQTGYTSAKLLKYYLPFFLYTGLRLNSFGLIITTAISLWFFLFVGAFEVIMVNSYSYWCLSLCCLVALFLLSRISIIYALRTTKKTEYSITTIM